MDGIGMRHIDVRSLIYSSITVQRRNSLDHGAIVVFCWRIAHH
jgi:hypothetical protein